jgi:Zn-dependent peptidase ImmA (M78 family)
MSKKAIKAARDCLRKLEEKGPLEFPIQVERLLETFNIKLYVTSELDDDISGLMVVKDDKALIAVNKNHRPNRQKFSIAHECGHYFLHRNSSRSFFDEHTVLFRDAASSQGIDPLEIEANAFAAELLMPREYLEKYIRNNPISVFEEGGEEFQKMANYFGVSQQALAIRLTRLGLAPDLI